MFLRYYAREWGGIQFSGVDECSGEERIANGDLIGGQTICNKPIHFVPWAQVYLNHLHVALAYYGGIVAVVIFIGLLWVVANRTRAPAAPFGANRPLPPAQHEHLV